MNLIAAALLAAIAATAAGPSISRESLQGLERAVDVRLENMITDDPFSILGFTRGVYLDGYGVVLTAEIELVPSAAPNPFRPRYTKDQIAKLKEKKKVRISFLKENMHSMLTEAANSLSALPPEENIALAITIPYFTWEDSEGMPRQILVIAPRKALLETRGKGSTPLAVALKVQEIH